MAAYDNVQLPGPPNGAQYLSAGANLAQALGGLVGGLGDAYQSGQDFRYKQRQQNLFQDSDSQAMLQDALKTGNYAPLLQKMIQSGGASTASSLIPALMSQSAGSEVGKAITDGAQPSTAPNYSPTGQTAAALDKASARTGGGPSNPRIPYTGSDQPSATDNAGAETVRTLTAGIANGRQVQEPTIANYARALGIDPDTPLSADQEARARKIIGNSLDGRGVVAKGTQPPPPATNDAASGGPPPINATSANQGNEPPAVGGGGGQAISPAPTAAAGAIQPSGPQVAQAAPRDTLTAADRGIRPTPVGTEAEARQLQAKAITLRALAGRIAGVNPKSAEQAKDTADKADDRAKQIFESIGKFNEPDRTTKAVQSGAARQEALDKSDVERFGKQYDAIQRQADETNKLVDTLKLTKGLMDQPSFYSGAGAEFVQSAKRIGVALGLTNPTEAQAMEAFGKTVSSAVMDQIRSLGGQGLGQVRVAEIKIMERAAQNHDNTPASNRLLTEMQMRMAEKWTLPIAEKAREYNNGHLDAGFDKVKQKWINDHPLLSKEELDDPRRIAPPLARTPADLAKIGWKDGMPFRTPDGRVLTHAPQPPGG